VKQANLVSVIIPVFNRPQMLIEAVKSVQEQSWSNIEIIIIDDGSTDQTASVAEGLAARDSRIIVRTIENGGPGAARNAGIAISRGAFIQFLDSDDLLLPEKLSDAIAIFARNLACDVVYSPTTLLFMDTDRSEGPYGKTGSDGMQLLPEFLKHRWWKTPTPLYRARIIRDAGPILELITEEDWEFECRIAAKHPHLEFSERPGSVCRMHSEERLSRPDVGNRAMWQSRCTAHLSVWSHAKQAEVSFTSAEVEHYMTSMFLLSRQCGAAGLPEASRQLLTAALEAAALGDFNTRQMTLYAAGARAIGWRLSGKLAHSLDVVRNAVSRLRTGTSEREVTPV